MTAPPTTTTESDASTQDAHDLATAKDRWVVRFGSYNLRDFRKHNTTEERARCDRVVEVIRALDADVLAVQEIHGVGRDAAARNLIQLADDTGMRCMSPSGQPVLADGGCGLYVGMLWWPDVPVASVKVYDRPWFRSPLAKVVLDCGGRQHQLASHHATPFGRFSRADEAEEVVAALTRPSLPGLLGHDANGISADRYSQPNARRGELYDPDPYADSPWFLDLIYQCGWDDGKHWADRTAGSVYSHGDLHDVAPVLDVPWQATAGHWPTCEYGRHGIRRRIDIIRATTAMLPALVGFEVHRTELALSASDHLPVAVSYDPDRIAANPRAAGNQAAWAQHPRERVCDWPFQSTNQ